MRERKRTRKRGKERVKRARLKSFVKKLSIISCDKYDDRYLFFFF